MARAKSTLLKETVEKIKLLANRGRDYLYKGVLDLGGPRVLTGFMMSNGATPIAQASGVGAPVASIGIDKGLSYLGDGQVFELSTSNPDQPVINNPNLTIGQSVIMAYFNGLALNAGVPTVIGGYCFGPVAATASVRAPNDSELYDAVVARAGAFGYDVYYPVRWVVVGLTQLNRTGDTTATQSTTNTARDSGLLL